MSGVNKYRKKPLVIEAILFANDDDMKKCREFIGEGNYDKTLKYPNVKTREGTMRVSHGDYIIKGVMGEFYPCKPDVFHDVYEAV